MRRNSSEAGSSELEGREEGKKGMGVVSGRKGIGDERRVEEKEKGAEGSRRRERKRRRIESWVDGKEEGEG